MMADLEQQTETAAPDVERSVEDLLNDGFDKMQAEPAETAPEVEELPETPAEEPAEAAAPEPVEPSVAAPEHWSAADKDRFAKLPTDDARKTLLDWRTQIETGAQAKFTEAATMRKEADEIGAALRPLDQIIQQHGISKADAVARLVGADQLLRQDLGQGLSAILSGYGRQLAGTDQARTIVRQVAQALGVEQGQAGQSGDQPKVDPRISELERTVAEMRSQAQAQADQQLAQIRQSAQQRLQAFADAKAEDGSQKHQHFEAVKADMAALMASNREAGTPITLEDAYGRAVWSRPELREAMTKAQQEAAAKAADEARRSKVANAKAAGTPQTKSAPGRREAGSDSAGKSTTALLEEQWDAAFGPAQ